MLSLWVSVALALAPADNADFMRGNELFAQYKYPEARAAMAKARTARGLDRATLLRILEVQGIAAGQQRQTAAAAAAFHELMVLDPDHTLDAEYAPRVMTPFFEARQAVIDAGALEFKPGQVQNGADKVELSVLVGRDPMKLARAVRFHFRTTADWKVGDATLEGGKATMRVDAPEVTWWAELLGDNEAQLELLGSEAVPRVERPPAAVALVLPPGSPVRAVSYGVLGAALVAGGVGTYFAFQSSDALSKIDRAARDGNGTITGLTEKAAYNLNASGKQNATIGNALFITGGALAIGGVLMWWFGAPVAVAPAPNGVTVSGSLP